MKIKSLIKTLMTFITLAATASLGLGQVGLSSTSYNETFIRSSDTIVEWTFPVSGLDRKASGGIAVNLDREISREPEFTGNYSDITGDGTRAVNSSRWEDGADSKYWIIDFATTGYENITLSSKQRGSNTGPRDFKVQVKLDGTEWIDVAGSEIVVAATSFASGTLSDIALPEICNNQGKVYLRWIMTNDTAINSSIVGTSGTNRIDNIFIKGYSVSTSVQHSLTLSSLGNGTTIPTSGIYVYNQGTNISIQAVPDSGWTFTGWSGDITSTDNPLAVTMNIGRAITAQFTELIVYHTVNFSVVGGNGNLTATVNEVGITTGDTVSGGNNIVFTAIPDMGYRVKEWTHNSAVVENNTTNTYTLENISSDATVTVEFEPIPTITYTVNFSVVGSNGSLSATVDSLNISSGSEVEPSKDVVFIAYPNTGYRVKEWKNNDVVVAGNTTNTYTVENLSNDINVTVEFELSPEYTLTINIVGNGSVTVNGAEYTIPMSFSEGSEVVLSAVSIAPWTFEGWTGGLVSTNSNETVTINSDITITATFTQLPETIVEWTFPDSVESRLASGGIAVNLDREISREPDFTGTYSYIAGDGTKAINTNQWDNGANSKYWIIDFATTGYENITLSSKQRGSNTGPRDFKVQVKLDGTEWIDVVGSEIVVSSTSFTSGTLSDIALPEICNNQGKVYLRWIITSDTSINGLIVGTSGTNRIDNIFIKGDNMSTSVQHSLTLTAIGEGTTSPASGTYAYNTGTNISVQAVPNSGWTFTGWSGDVVSTDNPVAVIMDADKTITAQFTEATGQYSVNFSVIGGNGNLSATVSGVEIVNGDTVLYGNNVVFTALPDSGYKVKEWKNNGTIVLGNTTNTYTVENLSENINVTVEFEQITGTEHTLTINIVGEGSVTVNGAEYTAPMLFNEGSEVALSAVSGVSWLFEGWTGGLVSTNSNETVTINSDITITATFIQLPETIVEWTFPDSVENRLASGGIAVNLDREISREPEFTGTYSYITGDGTKAINTSQWHNGADGKYWIIDFATTGYENITLSSKQRGSNTGPRDFKVQVKLDGTEWIDVAGSEIGVASTNFTSGALSDIALPEICNNQGKVYLRWIMTSDTSINGSIVGTSGTNRIDNIFVKGVVSAETHYSVTLTKNGLGQIVPDEGVYSYNSGTSITLQAIPDEGQVFEGWTGDIASSNTTEILLVNDNKVVTANFRPFASATINPTSGEVFSEETEYLSTVITWNDANEVTSITAFNNTLTEGEDYTITDNDGNTATLTFNVFGIITIKEITESEEILCEIFFDQGASSIYTIYNHYAPHFYVTFNITSGGAPVYNAKISINDEVLYTDETGQNELLLANGTYPYLVEKEGYEVYTGTLIVENEDQVVAVNLINGIFDQASSTIRCYPNPVFDMLTIERESFSKVKLEIYSIEGSLIMTQYFASDKLLLNLEGLKGGVYIIRLTDIIKSQTVRIIKQ